MNRILALLTLINVYELHGIEDSCSLNNASKLDRWFADKDDGFLRTIAEDTLDKHAARDKYYEAVSKPTQNGCHIHS